MSEWNVIHENFHTKHNVLTAPDEHMPYIIQLHIMSIRWAYYEQMKQQNVWSERETQTDRQTGRHREGGADGQTDRDRNKPFWRSSDRFDLPRSAECWHSPRRRTWSWGCTSCSCGCPVRCPGTGWFSTSRRWGSWWRCTCKGTWSPLPCWRRWRLSFL